MILYLHGFRSSPLSFKSRLLATAFEQLGLAQDWVCPQLPADPTAAIALCEQLIHKHQLAHPNSSLVLIGSSLGGFYATYLAEKYQCRAVLLNPAVYAARDLQPHVGTHTHYHSDEVYEFLAHYLDALRALTVHTLEHPKNYYLLACTGDEVLNWQEMVDNYQGCHQHIVQGSDHGISDFPLYQGEVIDFVLNGYRPIST